MLVALLSLSMTKIMYVNAGIVTTNGWNRNGGSPLYRKLVDTFDTVDDDTDDIGDNNGPRSIQDTSRYLGSRWGRRLDRATDMIADEKVIDGGSREFAYKHVNTICGNEYKKYTLSWAKCISTGYRKVGGYNRNSRRLSYSWKNPAEVRLSYGSQSYSVQVGMFLEKLKAFYKQVNKKYDDIRRATRWERKKSTKPMTIEYTQLSILNNEYVSEITIISKNNGREWKKEAERSDDELMIIEKLRRIHLMLIYFKNKIDKQELQDEKGRVRFVTPKTQTHTKSSGPGYEGYEKTHYVTSRLVGTEKGVVTVYCPSYTYKVCPPGTKVFILKNFGPYGACGGLPTHCLPEDLHPRNACPQTSKSQKRTRKGNLFVGDNNSGYFKCPRHYRQRWVEDRMNPGCNHIQVCAQA
jgi:hypothetical protein